MSPSTLDGANLYSYCGNNPVMGYDPDGDISKWLENTLKIGGAVLIVAALITVSVLIPGGIISVIVTGAAIGAASGFVFGGLAGGLSALANGDDFINGFANGALDGTITGAISGAIAASPLGMGYQVVANMAISAINYLATAQGAFDWGDFFISTGVGAIAGFVGGSGWLKAGGTLATDIALNGVKQSFAKIGSECLKEFATPVWRSATTNLLSPIILYLYHMFKEIKEGTNDV